MRIALYIIILFFIKSTFANEITIIELHNKSIDQVLIENSGDTYFRENDRVDKENFQEEKKAL